MSREGSPAYSVVTGSDLVRDGMYLELQDRSGNALAEVFYSDRESTFVFSGYRRDLPLQAVERLTAQAKMRLPKGSE